MATYEHKGKGEQEVKVTVLGIDYYLQDTPADELKVGDELSRPDWLPADYGMTYLIVEEREPEEWIDDPIVISWTPILPNGETGLEETEVASKSEGWWTVHSSPRAPTFDYVPTQEGDKDGDL